MFFHMVVILYKSLYAYSVYALYAGRIESTFVKQTIIIIL